MNLCPARIYLLIIINIRSAEITCALSRARDLHDLLYGRRYNEKRIGKKTNADDITGRTL